MVALGKRKRAPPEVDLPHGLGWKQDLTEDEDENIKDVKPKPKRILRERKTAVASQKVTGKAVQRVAALVEVKKEKRAKAHKYGLTPGESPFPDYPKPTREDCKKVNDLLTKCHRAFKQPATIPKPSMDVTGCGEVPDLLDALLRTLISANTSSGNSAKALKGLKEAFGLRTLGGFESINWNAVHEADISEVTEAMKSGGLAERKSKYIKAILDIVYEKNCTLRDAREKEKEASGQADILKGDHETQKAEEMEIDGAKENLLSMDYIFKMTTDEAMDEMVLTYPGIGVKTASCVILFCMQRPSFAVDTHVHRICRMLGWVPGNVANENKTFSHCEVRIPNELKYSLHQLFVTHGKQCGRCKAKGSAAEQASTVCPLEDLVDREVVKKGRKGKKAKEEEDSEEVTE